MVLVFLFMFLFFLSDFLALYWDHSHALSWWLKKPSWHLTTAKWVEYWVSSLFIFVLSIVRSSWWFLESAWKGNKAWLDSGKAGKLISLGGQWVAYVEIWLQNEEVFAVEREPLATKHTFTRSPTYWSKQQFLLSLFLICHCYFNFSLKYMHLLCFFLVFTPLSL